MIYFSEFEIVCKGYEKHIEYLRRELELKQSALDDKITKLNKAYNELFQLRQQHNKKG